MDRQVYERMNAYEAVHWWYSARRQIIETTIDRRINIPKDAAILEAGCGTGGNIAMLQRHGNVDAFEYDPAAREIACEKTGLSVLHGALPDHIPFAENKYDLIGLFDVLEHIEDDQAALVQLAARLKAGGKILVTVPALQWLWSRHDERSHHFRRYNRQTLKAVAKQAGMSVEYSFYFNSLLLPLAIATRAAKSVLKSNAPDDSMPSPLVNNILLRIFASERHLIGRLRLPIGLSICATLSQGSTEL